MGTESQFVVEAANFPSDKMFSCVCGGMQNFTRGNRNLSLTTNQTNQDESSHAGQVTLRDAEIKQTMLWPLRLN